MITYNELENLSIDIDTIISFVNDITNSKFITLDFVDLKIENYSPVIKVKNDNKILYTTTAQNQIIKTNVLNSSIVAHKINNDKEYFVYNGNDIESLFRRDS
jgi:hypothetical protein